MSKVIRLLPALPAALFCGLAVTATEPLDAARPGSALTVADATPAAFSLPVQGLTPAQLELFANGRQEFNQRWVVLPNIGGKWGRGPTSNGEICTDCHAGNGRGRAPESEADELVSMVV